MKKSILLALLVVLTVTVKAQFDKSKLRAGGGLVFATDIGNLGLTFNAVYHIQDEWEGAFAFTRIFKKDYTSFNIFDFDGHYIFLEENSDMNFYGIGGLAFTNSHTKFPSQVVNGVIIPGYTNSNTNLGLNIGVGMNYKIADNLNLAPEFRVTLSNGTYARIGASVQYLF